MPAFGLKSAFAFLLLLASACIARAQLPMLPDGGPSKADPAIKVPVFDVVSVKPHKSDDNMMRMQNTPDGFRTTNFSLLSLIVSAYNVRQDMVSGGPSWIGTARFDVEAKVAGPDVDTMKKLTPEQRRSMFQALLADRFQLKLHTETKTLPVYELVVARGGPKLQASAPEPPPEPDAKPDAAPKARSMIRMSPGELTGERLPMSNIVAQLANVLHRTVIDKTGLTGRYELSLKWTPEEIAMKAGAGAGDTGAETGPDIFTAVQEQLGLRLVSAKGQVDTLVVDHAEMPAEN